MLVTVICSLSIVVSHLSVCVLQDFGEVAVVGDLEAVVEERGVVTSVITFTNWDDATSEINVNSPTPPLQLSRGTCDRLSVELISPLHSKLAAL